MNELRRISSEDILAAAARIQSVAIRTPMIRMNVENGGPEIYLKMENLQPIGSFKIRPAANAILSAAPEAVAEGVYTASSGNMAMGVAYTAKTLGVVATVLLPEDAASAKVESLQRMGATIRFLGDRAWWEVLDNHGHSEINGLFIHPVANADVLAGNGTVGLEIYQDLPDVDTVVVPFGGGGLSTGIAMALRVLGSQARILAAESDHCAPLAAAFEAGSAVEVPIQPSFVSGLGVGRVLEEMWPWVKELVDDAVSANVEEIANAIRLLFERNRIIVEGAGAAGVAAALAGRAGTGKIVCVVSGGNLNAEDLIQILQGKVPEPS